MTLEVITGIHPAFWLLLAAGLALVLPRRVAYGVGTLATALVVPWAIMVPEGVHLQATFLGFDLAVVAVDSTARFAAITFGGFGAAAVIFAAGVDADRAHLTVGLGYVGAALVAVLAGDWLTVLIAWEALAVTSTLFVWLAGGQAIRAGFRYALIHGIGGALFLGGVALAAVGAGTGVDIGTQVWSGVGVAGDALWFGVWQPAGASLWLIGGAVAINAGVIGVHAWLPDTYPTPHVATSVFLAAYTTKVAVVIAARAFPDGNLALAWIGGAMTVYGAGFALLQKDMRRLLAYHIQAQVGYMLAGIGIGSALGIAGGFAHLLNNVFYKGLLFMVAGVIVARIGANRLDRFGAIGLTRPLVVGPFLVAAMAISGVPGFNGFVSKGMVLDAATEAGLPFLAVVLIVGAVGTVASFTKFGYYTLFAGAPTRMPAPGGLPAVAMVSIAGLCILFGVHYGLLFALLPATGAWTTDPYSVGHLLEAGAILAVGIGVFLAGRPILTTVHGGVDVDRLHDPLCFYGARWGSAGVATAFGWFDRASARLGWHLVDVVRSPAEHVRAWAAQVGIEEWYDHRTARMPGKTGTKLGLEGSAVVVGLVLVGGVLLAL